MEKLGIYLHIPFCIKKCAYCDFLSAAAGPETRKRYLSALDREIRTAAGAVRQYRVNTVYIGGGTPSLLEADAIARLLDTVRECVSLEADAEITMEANPGTLTERKLAGCKEAGVNRLSIGLQSADNRELALLGRIHTFEEFEENYRLARQTGFQNINVDLMAALPDQTEARFFHTLEQVLRLEPEHISVYDLILEEGTPFYETYSRPEGRKRLPSEESDRRMYHGAGEMLLRAGYERYEISNYAKPGCESRHNTSYWIGTDYLGLGLGASSYMKGVRYRNEELLSVYIGNAEEGRFLRKEETILTKKEKMEEFMFLGLRRMEGISGRNFSERFGVKLEDIYGKAMEPLLADGLLVRQGDRIRLSERGIDVSNRVFAEFLLEE